MFRDQGVLDVVDIVQGKIARKFIGYLLNSSPQNKPSTSVTYRQEVSNTKI